MAAESKKLLTVKDENGRACFVGITGGLAGLPETLAVCLNDLTIAHELAEVVCAQDAAIERLIAAVQRLRERAPHAACLADRIAQLRGTEVRAQAAPFLEA